MKTIKQSFQVKFNYKIIFTHDIFNVKNTNLIKILNITNKNKKKIIIFIDKNIHKINKDINEKIQEFFKLNEKYLNLVCKPILITGGEKIKNHYTLVKYAYNLIDKYKICRQSYILAIGGGTLLDLIGFVASTAHRGIRLIRIPTTTLSQDDSGVGVKNGINFNNKKNFIGCFNTPYAVINDFSLLNSLKDENFLEGFSEAIKVSLIKNKKLFFTIKDNTNKILNRDKKITEKIIYECAKMHADHISKKGDPFELTSSRPLDFGHWSAHKIESLSKYKISHGKSVSIGIALDCTYSYLLKILKKNEWKNIITTLTKLKLPIYSEELSNTANAKHSIFNGLEEFREHLGGKLTITLIKNIGKKIETHHINKNVYTKSIKLLKKLNNMYKLKC
ncbi:MAG TPA: 3-dehydroquinate synthase [Candidatus Azoamicus sp.]